MRQILTFISVVLLQTIPGWMSLAHGSDLSVIVVAEKQSDRGIALRLSRALLKRLAHSQDLKGIDMTEALDPEVSQLRSQDLVDGLAAAKTGLAALEQLDLEAAGGDLDLAVNLLLGYLDHLSRTEREVLDRAIFALGTVSMFEGNTETAESIFVALALLSPSYSPEVDGYATNVTKRYGELKAGLGKRPSGSVEVISVPAGATVFVDGTYRGVSPLKVDDLVDGQHVVLLERVGFISHGTLTPVNAGRNSRIEVDLGPSKATDILKGIEAELADKEESALSLGKKAGVKKLLALMLRTNESKTTVFGQWLDIENNKLLARIPETPVVKEPDIGATQILSALAVEIDPFANGIAAGAEEATTSEPWIQINWKELPQKWWFWAAVAGTVSAAAIGTSIALSGDEGLSLPKSNQHILGF